MHVGISQVLLRLHGIDSLKGKRGISKSLIARLRNHFNVSVSEIEHQDSTDYLGLGLASVSGSQAVIDQTFMKVMEVLQDDRRFELEEYEQTYV